VERLGLKNGATLNEAKCHLRWPTRRVLIMQSGMRDAARTRDLGGRRRKGSKFAL